MTQTVLTSSYVKDTDLSQSGSDTNYATAATIRAGSVFALGVDRAFRVFMLIDLLAGIGDGQFISGLTLSLKDAGDGSGSVPSPLTFNACRVTTTADPATATWNAPWALAGGDFTLADADTAVLSSATGDLEFTNLADVGAEAYANQGGKLGLLVKLATESPGASQWNAFGSFENTNAALRPVVTVTHSTSVHMQCAAAAKGVIEGLGLEGNPAVLVRKVPWHRPATANGADPNPAIILSTHQPTSHTPATNKSDDITYPVTASFYAGSDGSPTLNHARMLAWREVVRKAFHQKRLAGVDSVWQCTIPPSQPFNEGALVMGMRDVSALTLNFISREQRN